MFLEIACFNPESALQAVKAGSDRVELCINREEGGTSPTYDDFDSIKVAIENIPINVMIRPRGGDFEYTDDEFLVMKSTLTKFLVLGADGFVFGILKDGRVDRKRCKELVDLAGGKPCTFHRAFDELDDMEVGLRDVALCGMHAVLSSGGEPHALSGADVLKKLVLQAKNEDLGVDIIVGGGVRAANIASLSLSTRSTWYHSSALSDESTIVAQEEVMNMKKVLHSST
jgi:copper homeostasis protein